MNKLLIIFVLANLMTLVRGYVWQQMLQQNLMGDVELMAPSEADKKFKRCCEIEIGNGYCTNQMCSLSKISRMTHRAVIYYYH